MLPTLIPWQDDELLTEQRLDLRFYDDDWQNRVTIVAGEWPEKELTDVNGNPITDNELPSTVAAVIGEPTAVARNLSVGDRMPLSKQPNALEADLWLEVAAIVQPINGQDPFWYGELSPLRVRDDGRFLHSNAIVSRSTFFALADTLFPTQSPRFAWPVLIEPETLTLDHIPILQERLATLPDQLFQVEVQLQIATGLPDVVDNFAQQADDVRTPLTFLTATSALLAFFFVAMAATMAAARLQNEWDLLRSRGIGPWPFIGAAISSHPRPYFARHSHGGRFSLVAIARFGRGGAIGRYSGTRLDGGLADGGVDGRFVSRRSLCHCAVVAIRGTQPPVHCQRVAGGLPF